MKALIALRYPVRKRQIETINEALKLFPKAKILILHINSGNPEKTKEIVRKETGKRCEVVVEKGDITRTINRTAKKHGSDIVVLGKHRRSIIDSILEGIVETDTSARILKSIKRPVLVV